MAKGPIYLEEDSLVQLVATDNDGETITIQGKVLRHMPAREAREKGLYHGRGSGTVYEIAATFPRGRRKLVYRRRKNIKPVKGGEKVGTI